MDNLILVFLTMPLIMYIGIFLQLRKKKKKLQREEFSIREKYTSNNIFILPIKKAEEANHTEQDEVKKAA